MAFPGGVKAKIAFRRTHPPAYGGNCYFEFAGAVAHVVPTSRDWHRRLCRS